MKTSQLAGWVGCLATLATGAPVALEGQFSLAEALARLSQASPDLEYFALAADEQPRELRIRGEALDALGQVADAFGLQTGDLLGVAIVAPGPERATALEPATLLGHCVSEMPDPLRADAVRFLQAAQAAGGDWNAAASQMQARLEARLREAWQALSAEEGRPPEGLALVRLRDDEREALRQAVVGQAMLSLVRELRALPAEARRGGPPPLVAEARDQTVSLRAGPNGRHLGLVRLGPNGQADLADTAAPEGLERPARAVLLTKLVSLEGHGTATEYGRQLAAAARLDGCRLNGSELAVWRLRERPIWLALDVQGIARGRCWSPPVDAWVYGDAPASATAAVLRALPLEVRSRVWCEQRSRQPLTLAAAQCWQALSDTEREALREGPVPLDDLRPAAQAAVEMLSACVGPAAAVRAAAQELDGLGEAELYAYLRWRTGSVLGEYGQARAWTSRAASFYLSGAPERGTRPQPEARAGERQPASPMGVHHVSRW